MLDGYRADDRLNEDEGDDPGTPTTYMALAVIWAERDSRYAANKTALSAEQVQPVRDYRLKEANELPYAERARAAMMAKRWYPPEHGQGTGNDFHQRGIKGQYE